MNPATITTLLIHMAAQWWLMWWMPVNKEKKESQ